jgi:hypothetical protein
MIRYEDRLIHNLNFDGKLAPIGSSLHRFDCLFDRQNMCNELSNIAEYTFVRETDDHRPGLSVSERRDNVDLQVSRGTLIYRGRD